MRKWISILLFTLATCVSAQDQKSVTDARQIYIQAEQNYQIGRFNNVIEIIEPIINTLDENLRISAYRLLSLCYMEKDDMVNAEKYAKKLISLSPYYNESVHDPIRFTDLVERIKKAKVQTITTASQIAESLDEVPVPVTLITEEMIKASGAKNLRDVLMAYVPGITAIEGEECNISMRGLYSYSNENILIMRDGKRLNSHSNNSVAPDFRITLDNVKQIEVLRGPASSLYGNVALSAVVNIITKKGFEIEGIDVNYGLGDMGTQKGSFIVGKSFNDADFTMWGALYSSKGYKYNISATDEDFYGIIPKDGYIYVDGYNGRPSYDLGMIYTWKGLQISLSHQYSKRVHTYNSMFILSTYDYDNYSSIRDMKPGRGTSMTHANIDYSHKFNSFDFSGSLSYSLESTGLYNVLGDSLIEGLNNVGELIELVSPYYGDSIVLNSGAFLQQGYKSRTFGGELKVTRQYQLGKHQHGNILLGANYEHFNSFYNYFDIGDNYGRIVISTNNEFTNIYKNDKESSFSVYGQLKHYFSKKIILNGGLRYDYKKRYTSKNLKIVSPRFSVIYLPSSLFNIKASYSHSFVDAPYFYRASQYVYLGNENLDAQNMDNYQISSSVEFPELHLKYDGNIFYNHSGNVVMMTPNGYDNTGSMDIYGLENIVTYSGKHLNVNINGSYQKLAKSTNFLEYAGMIYAVPEVMINTIISRELNFLTKNLWIYAKASYKSKQKGLISNNFVYKINNDMGSTPYSISPSCIVDLGVRYSHRIMSANVWCYNLLNTNYKLGGDRVPVPQAGRTFLVTISLHL